MVIELRIGTRNLANLYPSVVKADRMDHRSGKPFTFLDPWQSRQRSYKFGSICTSVRPSICTYIRLRWAFLENASFNFSETRHEVRVP